MRCFPYAFTRWALGRIEKKRPGIIYMHPYEIDTKQIELDTRNLTENQRKLALKFHRMQMLNRSSVKKKIEKLPRNFEFRTLGEVVKKSAAN